MRPPRSLAPHVGSLTARVSIQSVQFSELPRPLCFSLSRPVLRDKMCPRSFLFREADFSQGTQGAFEGRKSAPPLRGWVCCNIEGTGSDEISAVWPWTHLLLFFFHFAHKASVSSPVRWEGSARQWWKFCEFMLVKPSVNGIYYYLGPPRGKPERAGRLAPGKIGRIPEPQVSGSDDKSPSPPQVPFCRVAFVFLSSPIVLQGEGVLQRTGSDWKPPSREFWAGVSVRISGGASG